MHLDRFGSRDSTIRQSYQDARSLDRCVQWGLNLIVAISHVEQREVDTWHFMQTAPWLGLLPSADGQVLHSQDGGDSPIVSLFKSVTAAILSKPGCPNPTSFSTLSKQAKAASTELNIQYFESSLYVYIIDSRVVQIVRHVVCSHKV